MSRRLQIRIGKIRATAIILFFCFALFGVFYPRFVSETINSQVKKPSAKKPSDKTQKETKQAKYSEFSHSVPQHTKLACDSCHKFPSANWNSVRSKDDAFPDITDYPKHESCLSCHRQQFFGSSKPTICAICHTNPGPSSGERHPFPNPREIFDKSPKGQTHVSDFEISFPHDKHIEIVGQNKTDGVEFITAGFLTSRTRRQDEEKSCAVCHQTYQPQGNTDVEFVTKPPEKLGDAFWLKKGTFKTSPISHAQCFTCHSQDTGLEPAPTNCAACHKLGKDELKPDFDQALATKMGISDKIMLTAWRSRHSSGTFRHEFTSHADLACSSCHNVKEMNTLEDKSMRVSISSCNLCHISATSADGGVLNLEVDSKKANPKFECIKCHVSFGKSATIPESHFEAIKAAGQ